MSFHQIRMARAGLSLTVKEMARLTGVSHDTITRLERGEILKASTEEKIRTRLQEVGVEFLGEDGVRIPSAAIDPGSGSGHFLTHLLTKDR